MLRLGLLAILLVGTTIADHEAEICNPTLGNHGANCDCECTCEPECTIDTLPETPVPTTTTPPRTVTLCETVPFDICLALDMSRSVNKDDPLNWGRLLDFTANLIEALDVEEDMVHVGVVSFSGRLDTRVSEDLTNFDKDDIIANVEGLEYVNTQAKTRTDLGLEQCALMLNGTNGRRGEVPQWFLTFTDGKTTEPDKTDEQFQILKDMGAMGLPLGIGDINITELLKLSTLDPNAGHTYFYAGNFTELPQVINELTTIICETQPLGG